MANEFLKGSKVMMVAGEASGDLLGSKLAIELGRIDPNIEIFGSTGTKMRAAGVESLLDSDDWSVVGIPGVVKSIPKFLRVLKSLKNFATKRKPDVVVLIDLPDLNLKLARMLHAKGHKVVYYVSPQLWAWRKYRISTIKNYVDLLIAILPFEEKWYADRGVHHVKYVGSPFTREIHPKTSRHDFALKYGLDPAKPIISLLPGSRSAEISLILPILLNTAKMMSEKNADLQFIVALPTGENVTESESKYGRAATTIWVEGETYDALFASDAAAVTSGTATLETGIIGTPMAIVYRTTGINYKLLRPIIDVEHFGLINLIAGERIVNEFIQHEFTPANVSQELFRLLEPQENKRVRKNLKDASEKLGHGGASKRAAEEIIRLIGQAK